MSKKIIITPDQLAQSATKYRKELLMMAVIALEASLKHMSVRTGIRGKEIVGELSGSLEIGPYDPNRTDTDGAKIVGRELETFLGSVIKKLDPNSVANSIYGSSILLGEGLKNVDIAKQVVAYFAKLASQSLNKNLWKAKRNASGTTTAELFNGFDTITTNEIADAKITTALRNLYEFTETITSNNAVDLLKAYYRASAHELQGQQTKLFIPFDVYNAYVDDYQQTVGPVLYNQKFEQIYLEGSANQCELVPLSNKTGTPFLHLTTKGNMLVGVNQTGEEEKISVEKHHAFLLDFVMALFFGTQFESISPERLLVGKLFVPAP